MRHFTEFRTCFTELWTRFTEIGTRRTRPPFQHGVELHQKDLRIIVEFPQILGPGIEVILEADMFLALSLIVPFYVHRDPFTRRRVDIQYPRPCQLSVNSQF